VAETEVRFWAAARTARSAHTASLTAGSGGAMMRAPTR
jgi:hypothetical protein